MHEISDRDTVLSQYTVQDAFLCYIADVSLLFLNLRMQPTDIRLNILECIDIACVSLPFLKQLIVLRV